MCELTEPVPGLVFDTAHLSATIPFAIVALIVWSVYAFALLWHIHRGELVMRKRHAWLLWAAGGICVLIGVSYAAFIGWPSDVALREWQAREEIALSAACQSAVLAPAVDDARTWQEGLFFVCFLAPLLASIVVAAAIFKAGVRKRPTPNWFR